MSNLTDPQITNGRPNTSMFHMPHTHSTTMDGGIIYPIACYESNPMDQVRMRRSNIIRVMPLVAPVGQDLWAFTASYRVPFHQVWANWPAFMAGMLSPDNEINRPQLPTVSFLGVYAAFQRTNHPWAQGSLAEFGELAFGPSSTWRRLGYPVFDSGVLVQVREFNALYLRANYHIWLNYYAHEWLDPERNVMTNNEYPYRMADTISDEEMVKLFTVRYAPHERDYFTTCNPAPQKGSAVGIPGAGVIIPDGTLRLSSSDLDYGRLSGTTNIVQVTTEENPVAGIQVGDVYAATESRTAGTQATNLKYSSGLTLGNTGALGSATMLDLAHAEHLQQWLEANSDYGNDYSDFIYGHFGIRPSGLGLMVPQRLSFTRQRIQISDIHQTGGTYADTTLDRVNVAGEYAGRGFSSDGSHQYSYFEDLYSAVITHMWIRPETIYHGTHRRFTRIEPADFFSPEFIADGDQPVYYSELVDHTGPNYDTNGVFGYNDRYGELKYEPSTVSGELRTQSMNSWSLHRDLPRETALNTDFVYCKDFPSRIFAYTGTGDSKLESIPRFVVYSHANMFARKGLPKTSRRSLMLS